MSEKNLSIDSVGKTPDESSVVQQEKAPIIDEPLARISEVPAPEIVVKATELVAEDVSSLDELTNSTDLTISEVDAEVQTDINHFKTVAVETNSPEVSVAVEEAGTNLDNQTKEASEDFRQKTKDFFAQSKVESFKQRRDEAKEDKDALSSLSEEEREKQAPHAKAWQEKQHQKRQIKPEAKVDKDLTLQEEVETENENNVKFAKRVEKGRFEPVDVSKEGIPVYALNKDKPPRHEMPRATVPPEPFEKEKVKKEPPKPEAKKESQDSKKESETREKIEAKETNKNKKVAKENPPTLATFGLEHSDLFKRMGDEAKRFLMPIVEKVWGGIKDRVSLRMEKVKAKLSLWTTVAFNEKFMEFHQGRTQKFSSLFKEYDSKAAVLQSRVAEIDKVIADTEKKYSNMHYRDRVSIIRERNSVMREIQDIEAGRDKWRTKLETANQKQALWENRRNAIIGRGVEGVNEHLEPHENRMAELQRKKSMIDSEISTFREDVQSWKSDLKDVEKQMAAYPYLKHSLGREKRKIVTNIKNAEMTLAQREKARNRLEPKFIRVNKRINRWRDLRNVYNRVLERKGVYDERPRNDREVDVSKVEIEYSNVQKVSREGPVVGNGFGAESKAETQTSESLESPKKLIEYTAAWNKYFGSELLFQVAFIPGADKDSKMDKQEFKSLLFKFNVNQKSNRRSFMTESRLAEAFSMLEKRKII